MAKILCIDDDPKANILKCTILSNAGHQVDTSLSAQDAIQKIDSNRYDAVITDWRVAEASARLIIQAARLKSETLVLVVSGFVAEAFQAAGPAADLYLDKPVDPAELVVIINTLLSERQGQQTGT